ncbi:MAG: hypothetical protein ACLU3I_22385 [Acutalibacteraceae bacterium]
MCTGSAEHDTLFFDRPSASSPVGGGVLLMFSGERPLTFVRHLPPAHRLPAR